MLCCAVLCCAVLCCAVLCCAVLCCAVLCCAVLCCAVLCCAVLCCAVLCCAVLSWSGLAWPVNNIALHNGPAMPRVSIAEMPPGRTTEIHLGLNSSSNFDLSNHAVPCLKLVHVLSSGHLEQLGQAGSSPAVWAQPWLWHCSCWQLAISSLLGWTLMH